MFPPLTLDALSIGYGHKVLSSNLRATLPKGQLTALIGRNGAGKSTLLRCVAALSAPLAGRVLWGADDAHRLSLGRRAKLLSVVLTERVEVQHLTVAETVAMGRTPYTSFLGRLSEDDTAIVERSMAQTGIRHLAHRPLTDLSDGERQRTMIAKALAQETPLILLDEPTSFLDYRAKIDILNLLHDLAHGEGKTILFSTHEIELSLRMADHLWLLREGTMGTGSPTDLSASGELQDYFSQDGLQLETQTWRLSPLPTISPNTSERL